MRERQTHSDYSSYCWGLCDPQCLLARFLLLTYSDKVCCAGYEHLQIAEFNDVLTIRRTLCQSLWEST